MDKALKLKLIDALKQVEGGFPVIQVERGVGSKVRLPFVKQFPLRVPESASAFALNPPGKLDFKLVNTTTAISRITLSESDIKNITDLPAFCETIIKDFADLSGFTASRERGVVYGITGPTFVRPGGDDNFVRDASNPPDSLEIRMYTDYVPNKKTSRKKQR